PKLGSSRHLAAGRARVVRNQPRYRTGFPGRLRPTPRLRRGIRSSRAGANLYHRAQRPRGNRIRSNPRQRRPHRGSPLPHRGWRHHVRLRRRLDGSSAAGGRRIHQRLRKHHRTRLRSLVRTTLGPGPRHHYPAALPGRSRRRRDRTAQPAGRRRPTSRTKRRRHGPVAQLLRTGHPVIGDRVGAHRRTVPHMITGNQLSYAYGTQTVVDDVSLTTSPGRVLGLIGPNGSGKTTLLRLLSGSLKPQAGAVHIDDVPLGKLSPREIARQLSVVVQESDAETTITVG